MLRVVEVGLGDGGEARREVSKALGIKVEHQVTRAGGRLLNKHLGALAIRLAREGGAVGPDGHRERARRGGVAAIRVEVGFHGMLQALWRVHPLVHERPREHRELLRG
eukprot:2526512-Prymnesium_polylepis.1